MLAMVCECPIYQTALQWRHYGRDGVSNHQPHDCLLNRLFRRRSKKTPKLRVTDLCEGNSSVTGEFLAQRASYAENVLIWWRHRGHVSRLWHYGNHKWIQQSIWCKLNLLQNVFEYYKALWLCHRLSFIPIYDMEAVICSNAQDKNDNNAWNHRLNMRQCLKQIVLNKYKSAMQYEFYGIPLSYFTICGPIY